MSTKTYVLGIALIAPLFVATPADAGGRYPLHITKIHGNVQVRLEQSGNRWRKAKLGC